MDLMDHIKIYSREFTQNDLKVFKKEIPIVCHESCMADGGRPSGNGLQEQSPNRPELHM